MITKPTTEPGTTESVTTIPITQPYILPGNTIVTDPNNVIIAEPEVPTTEVEIEDPDVPMAEEPTEDPTDPSEEVIVDEDVPLADSAIQVTGDTIVIWLALAGVSCAGIVSVVAYYVWHKEH